MTVIDERATPAEINGAATSLTTAAARNLATTTKTVPQMQEISSRWLLRVLPWIQVSGGAYRVNRRLTFAIGDGRLTFTNVGNRVRVVPPELCELPPLRGYGDLEVLDELSSRFTQTDVTAGEAIVQSGRPADTVYLLAHGKADKIGTSRYGTPVVLSVIADGQFFGDRVLVDDGLTWDFTVKATTACIVLALARSELLELLEDTPSLAEHLARVRSAPVPKQNRHGESEVALAAGHAGEHQLPATFVDYELSPREYDLSVAQTVLRCTAGSPTSTTSR